MYFLSIISPFYNSEKKCSRLLDTLSKIDDVGVELIFIDDGSTDGTLNLLRQFNKDSKVDIHVITQENKGPGGARNTGLKVATGKYVWFVDSDDDINIEAINFVKEHINENYDFIDFDYNSEHSVVNSMSISSGIYSDNIAVRNMLLENFGRIWTKCIRRELILDNNIFYPEYCIYEDNPLIFIYPFVVQKFCKSKIVGYIHYEEYESVTRSIPTLRYFDRMNTAVFGLKKGLVYATELEREKLYKKFIQFYLINTVGLLMTRFPSRQWLIACKVMRQFRYVSQKYDIGLHPHELVSGSLKFKTLFSILWVSSYFMFDQNKYFGKLRLKTWGNKFNEDI